jgi:S-formylglutathione hydrolase
MKSRAAVAWEANKPLYIEEIDVEGPADQLFPRDLESACADRGFPLTLRYRDGYDHSYHFIATFIGEHLAYHAKALAEA